MYKNVIITGIWGIILYQKIVSPSVSPTLFVLFSTLYAFSQRSTALRLHPDSGYFQALQSNKYDLDLQK
jgi:hypothetical protein